MTHLAVGSWPDLTFGVASGGGHAGQVRGQRRRKVAQG